MHELKIITKKGLCIIGYQKCLKILQIKIKFAKLYAV